MNLLSDSQLPKDNGGPPLDDSYGGAKERKFEEEYENFWSDMRQEQDFLALVNQ